MLLRNLLLSLGLLLFTSCGYHFGHGGELSTHKAIYVPYIEGDERGYFTNALIYALAKESALCYDERRADLLVKVCLQAPVDMNIGFAYASGEEAKVVVSNESRLTVIAEVRVIDCATGALVKRCDRVVASIDYDFASDFSHEGEDTFSIGQLKMYNEARDTSQLGLAQLLAEKIVDSLLYYW